MKQIYNLVCTISEADSLSLLANEYVDNVVKRADSIVHYIKTAPIIDDEDGSHFTPYDLIKTGAAFVGGLVVVSVLCNLVTHFAS